jgi:hypothetical protein
MDSLKLIHYEFKNKINNYTDLILKILKFFTDKKHENNNFLTNIF